MVLLELLRQPIKELVKCLTNNPEQNHLPPRKQRNEKRTEEETPILA
jgi:hypothetical protein